MTVRYGEHEMYRKVSCEAKDRVFLNGVYGIESKNEFEVYETIHTIEYRCNCGYSCKSENKAEKHLLWHNKAVEEYSWEQIKEDPRDLDLEYIKENFYDELGIPDEDLPDDIVSQREIERKREENKCIGEFSKQPVADGGPKIKEKQERNDRG